MKLYRIEALGFGRYFEHDVNCPPEWIGSGVYDVEHEAHQEAWFEVVAESQHDALAHIAKNFYDLSDFDITFTSFWYDPTTIVVEDYDDDDVEPPYLMDWGYSEPVEGDGPKRYSRKIA